jgi:hypothetical protein
VFDQPRNAVRLAPEYAVADDSPEAGMCHFGDSGVRRLGGVSATSRKKFDMARKPFSLNRLSQVMD